MKAIIPTIALLAICTTSCGDANVQSENSSEPVKPPEAVVKALEVNYRGAKQVSWEDEGDGNFEAAFTFEGKNLEATFSSTGEWLETEEAIDLSDLPRPAFNAVESAYESFEVTEVEMVQSPDFSGYEIEIKVQGKIIEVHVNAQGEVYKIAEEEYDDDGYED